MILIGFTCANVPHYSYFGNYISSLCRIILLGLIISLSIIKWETKQKTTDFPPLVVINCPKTQLSQVPKQSPSDHLPVMHQGSCNSLADLLLCFLW